MTAFDYTIIALMGLAALTAAGSFSAIAKYLFDRGLAERNDRETDLRKYYRSYLAATRKENGRAGSAFWVHCVSAGIFICTGVGYTIVRLILPRFF